jgi:folate-binding protein YgfZ
MNDQGYSAASSTCARLDLSGRDLLRVTGPDRVGFVQGMVTNDVEALPVGGANYAAMLTAKGAMVGDVRVLKRESELLLDTGPGRGGVVLEFLNKFLISEEAEVVAAPDVVVVGLMGPEAPAWAAKLDELSQGRFESFSGGVDMVVPRAALASVEAALSALPVLDEATLEVLRVERGVPVFGVDMTETTIPLEANLEHAINYKKGCYIGQEVIARATYRGQMNKKLVGLALGTLSPAVKTELQLEGKKVGWLTSVVFSPRRGQHLALGYVRRDYLAPGTVLEVAGGGTATVTSLPF